MGFLGRLRLPQTADALRGHLPMPETWLRLNPQWSVLAFEPADGTDRYALRVRRDEDDLEEDFHADVVQGDAGWRIDLSRDGAVRGLALELTPAGGGCELALRDTQPADEDASTHAQLLLWLRAVADYMLISANSRWRGRFGKWLLDRLWLRMSLTGRRVVILILAYEAIGLALLVGWLVWERLAV